MTVAPAIALESSADSTTPATLDCGKLMPHRRRSDAAERIRRRVLEIHIYVYSIYK